MSEYEEELFSSRERLGDLEKMRDKYRALGRSDAVRRTEARIIEVVEDILDLERAVEDEEEFS